MPLIDTIVLFREVGFHLQSHMYLLYLRRLQSNEFVIKNISLLELEKTKIPKRHRM